MEEELLTEFGLTRNEVNVYLTLLKMGSSLAGQITEKTGIHRRNVYDALERLQEKGLVSFVIINNKKLFSSANPKRFVEIIEENKHRLDIRKKEFKNVLPRLNSLMSLTQKHDVRFFKDVEGLKTVYEDILRTGKNYVGYGPGEDVEKILKFYFKHYVQRRKELKIRTRLIYPEKDRGKKFIKTTLSEARFLPNKYSSHAALRIYGDKVALLLLSEDEPLAIIVKNKKIADGYKKYFEVIWNSAKI